MENTILQLAELVGELAANNNELRESLNNTLADFDALLIDNKNVIERCNELQKKYRNLHEAAAAYLEESGGFEQITSCYNNLEKAVNELK